MTYQRKQEYEFNAKDTFVVRKAFKSNGRNYVSGNSFDKACVSERRLRQMVVSGHLVPEGRVADAPAAPEVVVGAVVESVIEPVVVVDVVVEESKDAVLEGAVTADGDLVEVEKDESDNSTDADVSEIVKEVPEMAVEAPAKRGPGRPKVK